MERWPFWRVLVWVEAWLLLVWGVSLYRGAPSFFQALGAATLPAGLLISIWTYLTRRERRVRPMPAASGMPAMPVELTIAAVAVAAAAFWIIDWAIEARQDLERFNQTLGQGAIIVDVSIGWVSALACFSALAIDWMLSGAASRFGAAMTRLRRTHVIVTICHVAALFASAWIFLRWPDAASTGTATDASILLQRARSALTVYEFARATVLPVQAFFAAVAILFAAASPSARVRETVLT